MHACMYAHTCACECVCICRDMEEASGVPQPQPPAGDLPCWNRREPPWAARAPSGQRAPLQCAEGTGSPGGLWAGPVTYDSVNSSLLLAFLLS